MSWNFPTFVGIFFFCAAAQSVRAPPMVLFSLPFLFGDRSFFGPRLLRRDFAESALRFCLFAFLVLLKVVPLVFRLSVPCDPSTVSWELAILSAFHLIGPIFLRFAHSDLSFPAFRFDAFPPRSGFIWFSPPFPSTLANRVGLNNL